MENKKSNFYSIIHCICQEQGITCTDYADGWAFELKKGEQKCFLFGYQFGLNLSVVQQLCNDKGAASEAMEANGIPHVHHIAYMCPAMQKYVGGNGCFQEILDYFAAQGNDLVVKDNEGTGGNFVFHVTNRKALEMAAYEIFSGCKSIALCPYYEIEQEFRIVLLDGEVKVIFSKLRPGLTGDGVSTLRQLYSDYLLAGGKVQEQELKDLDRIPEEGEFIPFGWKHNLGQGASAALIDPAMVPEEIALAKKTAAALRVRFGSFDIIRCADGIRVLEVNTGVMMENLAGMSNSNYELVKGIYTEAIRKMLEA